MLLLLFILLLWLIFAKSYYIQLRPINIHLGLLKGNVEFLWWGWGGRGMQSHIPVKPNFRLSWVWQQDMKTILNHLVWFNTGSTYEHFFMQMLSVQEQEFWVSSTTISI